MTILNPVNRSNNNFAGLDRGFNQRFIIDPSIAVGPDKFDGIYTPNKTEDIVETLNEINSSGESIKSGQIRVTSGGHCYENFVFQQSTEGPGHSRYIFNLSAMNEISEETLEGTEYITIQPGASNFQMQTILHAKYGKTLPGGSCYSVCAGGHIAGGGYGLLSRLHGLTVDYLAGVEIITPPKTIDDDFKIRYFTKTDADNLNKAHRGGGAGNFGIITKYYFEKNKLPPSPEHALFYVIPVPWSQFTNGNPENNKVQFAAFCQRFQEACEALPWQAFVLGKFSYAANHASDEMHMLIQVVYGQGSGHASNILGGLDVPEIDESEALGIIEVFHEALGLFAPDAASLKIRKNKIVTLIGHPVSATVELGRVYDLPWIKMTQMLNGSGDNNSGKYKSSYMKEPHTEAEAGAAFDFLTGPGAEVSGTDDYYKSQTLIQIDSYGGQINEMDKDENTVVRARNSTLKLQYQTYWKELEGTPSTDGNAIITWLNNGYSNIHSTVNGTSFPAWGDNYEGCYYNYCDRHIGVNNNYTGDPGEATRGDFMALYFGAAKDELMEIKTSVDPQNIFAFSQSIPVTEL
jgi:FAD/FMN-containing dehydrogenase